MRLAFLAALVGMALAGCSAQPPAPVTDDNGVEGVVLVGPTCPVERDPPDPACADRPHRAHLEVLTLDDRYVKDFWSGEDGTFRVALDPGQYRIGPAEDDASPPTCARTDPFTVRLDEFTQVDVACDSGIR